MKQVFALVPALMVAMIACQQTPAPTVQPSSPLAMLELAIGAPVDTQSKARVSQITPRLGTIREGDVTFSSTANVATFNDSAYSYVQAQFRITNNSATAFNNLTLYAVARAGNTGNTAIKNITNFGGWAIADQARIAQLVTPIHGVNFTPSAIVLIPGREDFQAFEESEQTDLQTAFNAGMGGFSSGDKALGYGFVARRCIPDCTTPTSFARDLPAGNTNGLLTVAMRIPRTGALPYGFTMTFAVVDEPVMRVTRSVYPPETLSNAELRLNNLGSSSATDEVMQIGLSRVGNLSSTKANKGTNLVVASNDGTAVTYAPMGLGLKNTISAGRNHSLSLKSDGTVLSWGDDSVGQLGNGALVTADQPTPVAVSSATGITSVAAGFNHSIALKSDGTLLSWGNDTNGELGNNAAFTSQSTPVVVSGATSIEAIATGGYHTLAQKLFGTLLSWGLDDNGQLGDGGTNTNQPAPVAVGGLTGIVAIAARRSHSLALKSDGTLLSWGDDSVGQLGNGALTTADQTTPVAVSGATGIVAIAAGDLHSLALKSDGTLLSWGDDGSGQLGDNATLAGQSTPVVVSGATSIVAIAAGAAHSLALKSDGTLLSWGDDSAGQLGDGGTNTNQRTPVAVSGATGIVAIAAGYNHSLALKSDGTLLSWGDDTNGQLGDNATLADQPSPVAVALGLNRIRLP